MDNLKFFIKKFLILIFMLAINLFLLTGCAKVSYTFDIDEKNTTINEIRAVDFSQMSNKQKHYEELIDAKISSKNKDDKGFEISKYLEGSFLGIKKTKTIPTYQFGKNSLPLGFSTPQKNIVEIERGFIKNKYVIYLQYNPDVLNDIISKTNNTFVKSQNNINKSSVINQEPRAKINNNKKIKQYKTPEPLKQEDNSASESVLAIKNQEPHQTLSMDVAQANFNIQYQDSLKKIKPNLELTIKIPKKASSHNASEVISNTEYKWILPDDCGTEINIEYTRYDFSTLAWLITFMVLFGMTIFYYEKFKHGEE